jgi:hypothetical protein
MYISSALGSIPATANGKGTSDSLLHIKSLKTSAVNLHLTLVILDGAIVRQFVGATVERYILLLPSPPLPLLVPCQ